MDYLNICKFYSFYYNRRFTHFQLAVIFFVKHVIWQMIHDKDDEKNINVLHIPGVPENRNMFDRP